MGSCASGRFLTLGAKGSLIYVIVVFPGQCLPRVLPGNTTITYIRLPLAPRVTDMITSHELNPEAFLSPLRSIDTRVEGTISRVRPIYNDASALFHK